jgi:hypothetical protein
MDKQLLPFRKDGMPDLNNWQEFIKQGNYKNLGDLLTVSKTCSTESHEGILVRKAIMAIKNEIAEKFIKALCEEEISIKTAISILELTSHKIMEIKLNP